MNPLFDAIFWVLAVECLLLALLVSPMPANISRPCLKWFSNSSLVKSIMRPIGYFFVMVALTWLFTTREMLRLQTEYAEHKTGGDIGQKLQHEARMFRSQRNFYLCGSCALLLLVIRRIYQLVREVQSLSASRAALEKQAMGAVAAYNAMAADKTPADKTPSSKPETTVPPEAKAASSTSAAEPLASEEPVRTIRDCFLARGSTCTCACRSHSRTHRPLCRVGVGLVEID